MLHTISFELGEMNISLETGKVAKQANGAVWLTCEDTVLLATTTVQQTEEAEKLDFLALTVHYQEKLYATGRIPGNYGKRQGKRTDEEIFTARRTDRSVRPLFPSTFRAEVDLIVEALSASSRVHPEALSVLASSTALMVSDLPFFEPVGAVRVIKKGGILSVNLHSKISKNTDLDLFVAATESSILVVEGTAQFLPESEVIEAIAFAQKAIRPMIQAQKELREAVAPTTMEYPTLQPLWQDEANGHIQSQYAAKLLSQTSKKKREFARKRLLEEFLDKLPTQNKAEASNRSVELAFDKAEKQYVQQMAFREGKRLDGRKTDEIRPVTCEINVLPRTHGSALFTRGDTQALVTVTLGGNEDEQNQETIYGPQRKHFYLHYNFPNYATGKCGRFGIWNRREVGHGHLAEQALRPVLPRKHSFPYTLCVISEITEANGSSSMATVCGGTLALLSAGVPLKNAIAGSSVALFRQEGQDILLSDPLGEEDVLGDMDLKVCGSHDGITAIHMDLKVPGISLSTLEASVTRARIDRRKILELMENSITEPQSISQYAPQIVVWEIPQSVAKSLLGQGGKKLRKLKEQTGAKIVVNPSGSIRITAPNQESITRATEYLQKFQDTPKGSFSEEAKKSLKTDEYYEGTITHIKEYGAFIRLNSGETGLIHISELAEENITDVSQHLELEQVVRVRLLNVDKKGRFGFSLKEKPKKEGE